MEIKKDIYYKSLNNFMQLIYQVTMHKSAGDRDSAHR